MTDVVRDTNPDLDPLEDILCDECGVTLAESASFGGWSAQVIDGEDWVHSSHIEVLAEKHACVSRHLREFVEALSTERVRREKAETALASVKKSQVAAIEALYEIEMKPYRAEEVVTRWRDDRTHAAMARRAVRAGEGDEPQ